MPVYLVVRRRRIGLFLVLLGLISVLLWVGGIVAYDLAAYLDPTVPNPPVGQAIRSTLVLLATIAALVAWVTRRSRARWRAYRRDARLAAAPHKSADTTPPDAGHGDVRVLRITDIQQVTDRTERVWATDTVTGTAHDLWLPEPGYPLGAYVIVSISAAGEFTVHGWLPAYITAR